MAISSAAFSLMAVMRPSSLQSYAIDASKAETMLAPSSALSFSRERFRESGGECVPMGEGRAPSGLVNSMASLPKGYGPFSTTGSGVAGGHRLSDECT